jgi:hypothetical protein
LAAAVPKLWGTGDVILLLLTTMTSDSSPLCPPELEREIFETATHFHPDTILNLLLVSHRVYEW